jgi:hypothetical protein
MRFFKSIPTLAYVVGAYNILAFFGTTLLGSNIWQINLPSGAQWTLSVNELLLTLAVIFLYIEIFRATRTSTASIVDHALSMALFIICLLEFIIIARFGNSTFFIITLICLLDVVAGFTVTISTARRDFGIGTHAAGG